MTAIGVTYPNATEDRALLVSPSDRRRALFGSAIGSMIEWYDYFLYGTMSAIVFGKLFFPTSDALTSQLLALASFALAFLIRPIGGIVFSHVGDRIGRKKTLVVTLSLMGVSTMLIGLMPTHATIGVWAPILLTVLRLVQGLALGGEWGGGLLLAVEYSPREKRGVYGAVPQTGALLGLALGNVVTSLLSAAIPEADFLAWGWRIPFVLSIVLVFIGLWIRHQIDELVDQDYQKAESLEAPKSSELMSELYGDLPRATAPPLEGGRKWRMVDAVNQVFRRGLSLDKNYLFFGEDIEDPKGGVFKLTAGLSSEFPDRVFNSPLAEATIAGVAIGMACYGMKPVFELQFVDFVGPAWNQISQNMATIRWRTFGDWQCPTVIYSPYGAYLPGGSIWHSQANESSFAHVPGLRVVVPSTPEDAAGLMWTAMHAEDPTVYLIPKHLFRQQMDVPEQVDPVPFGKAKIRSPGSDVTLVAWGNAMEPALQAVLELEEEVSIEVIDLRSIVPWDESTIAKSLEKTGRLVVVQEDAESCSVGQMIISRMTSNPDWFCHFISPPQLVSRPDVHIGYNPIYEYAALPDVARVTAAIRLTMED